MVMPEDEVCVESTVVVSAKTNSSVNVDVESPSTCPDLNSSIVL